MEQFAPSIEPTRAMKFSRAIGGVLTTHVDRQGRIGGNPMPAAALPDDRFNGGGQFARHIHDDVPIGGGQLRVAARLMASRIPSSGSFQAGIIIEPGCDAARVRGHAEWRVVLFYDNRAA